MYPRGISANQRPSAFWWEQAPERHTLTPQRRFGVQPLTGVHDLVVLIGLGNKGAPGNAAFVIN